MLPLRGATGAPAVYVIRSCNTLSTAIHCKPFGPVFPGSPGDPGGPTTGCFPLFRPSRTEKQKTNYYITPSYHYLSVDLTHLSCVVVT